MRLRRLALLISLPSAFAILSCGETVVRSTTSTGGPSPVGSGGSGAAAGAGATAGAPAGTGGEGGENPVCGPSCLECCNDDACPDETPNVGDTCAAPIDCIYLTTGGCLQHWFCSKGEPDFWTNSIGPLDGGAYACPGSCPPEFTGVLDPLLCFAPGMTCAYEITVNEEKACWSYTCQADHHWTSGEKIGDVCP